MGLIQKTSPLLLAVVHTDRVGALPLVLHISSNIFGAAEPPYCSHVAAALLVVVFILHTVSAFIKINVSSQVWSKV